MMVRQWIAYFPPARCHRSGFHDLLILFLPSIGKQLLLCLLTAFGLLVLFHSGASSAQNSGFSPLSCAGPPVLYRCNRSPLRSGPLSPVHGSGKSRAFSAKVIIAHSHQRFNFPAPSFSICSKLQKKNLPTREGPRAGSLDQYPRVSSRDSSCRIYWLCTS